jgi:cation-transporting ATPase 13A2
VSFTYFREDDDSLEWHEEEAVDIDGEVGGIVVDDLDTDLEAAVPTSKPKRASYSRSSLENPLLSRHESTNSYMIRKKTGGRVNQKIYIVTEDLTAVITGFSTSVSGLAIYVASCVLSLGSAYLLLRWLPKWRMRLVGIPAPLRKCQWVAIEVGHMSPGGLDRVVAN